MRQMIEAGTRRWAVVFALCGLLGGCAANWGAAPWNSGKNLQRSQSLKAQSSRNQRQIQTRKPDLTCRERIITNNELLQWSFKDPALTPNACRKILARLNNLAEYLIFDAIAKGTPLKVPDDFAAYQHWTPMPRMIPALRGESKIILVVKNHPFLGWYRNGKLLGDAFAGIGRPGERTHTGLFRVLQKDANHHSASYDNVYGTPAWMPWALRIYGHVWIHAGDITGPYSSHGCVMLPPGKATALFRWADRGTAVLIIPSLADLNPALAKYSRELSTRVLVSDMPHSSAYKN